MPATGPSDVTPFTSEFCAAFQQETCQAHLCSPLQPGTSGFTGSSPSLCQQRSSFALSHLALAITSFSFLPASFPIIHHCRAQMALCPWQRAGRRYKRGEGETKTYSKSGDTINHLPVEEKLPFL